MTNDNFLAKTLRILVLFTQKFVIKLSKIWVSDPEKPIPDPGSMFKKAQDPGSRSATLVENIAYLYDV
jgi:hypothetical protein